MATIKVKKSSIIEQNKSIQLETAVYQLITDIMLELKEKNSRVKIFKMYQLLVYFI